MSRTRVVVTGGAGFVGSHLVDRLVGDGSRVLVIDDLSSGRAANLADAVRLEKLDVSTDDVVALVCAWRPDIVYHLAAQTSVPRSMEDPLRDLFVNVVGTHRIVAAARAAAVSRLVFVSSGGAIYGESRRAATERTRPTPTSYYGIHKLAGEGHVAVSGIPHAIVRPSNIYGPRQSGGLEGAVVASFVDRATARQALAIDGDGNQTRDFIHVRDVVEAIVRLGNVEAPSGVWNVASGRGLSINQLAEIVERAAGVELGRVYRAARSGDVRDSVASSARLRALGWRASVSISRGVGDLLVS